MFFPGNEFYRFMEPIGAGSSGEIWRVELWRSGKPLGIHRAVKVSYFPSDSEQAQRELAVLSRLRDHNSNSIVTIHEYGVFGNRLYLVMELATGTLFDRIREYTSKGSTFQLDELLTFIQEAAIGLDYLHTAGAGHGGIQPRDILICEGHAKVSDFGLIYSLKSPTYIPLISSLSTLACMAPELKRGEPSVHSDQYALACTYAWMRLGEPLGQGLTDVTALGTLARAEKHVVETALAQDPDRRFASCTDFASALRAAVHLA